MALLKRYAYFFLMSWLPAYDGGVGRFSLLRLLILSLFWPLFLLVQAINGLGLLMDYLLFPNFRRVQIREPLFVVGVPRSGTTFLHRLLAMDERFTTAALWELLFAPSITQRYFWTGVARLDRWMGRPAGRFLFWIERRLLGGLDGVHKTGLLDPEEDYLALMPVWGCFLLVLAVPVPALWRLAYLDRNGTDQEKQEIITAYRRFVQRHLYFHGSNKQLLSKNPSFTPWMSTLAQAFPDARFIGCIRSPSAAVPSQINSILMGVRLFDGRDTTDYWRQGFMTMLDYYYRHLLEVLESLPPERQALSVMEHLAPAPAETVLALYQRFGWQADATLLQQLDAQDRKAKQYRSSHHYSLDTLGLGGDELLETFGWVYERFGFIRPDT